jgi:aminoglycoside/choline kinase family phosphotransferase
MSGEGERAASEGALLARLVESVWPRATLAGVEPLAGDASARRYVRLRLADGDAPPTAVAMLLPPEARAASEEIARAPLSAELPFLDVQRAFERGEIPAPRVFADAVDQGALLLEDIGDLTLASAALDAVAHGRGEATLLALLLPAVDLLAAIAALQPNAEKACAAFAATYDREIVARELDVFRAYGFARGGDNRDAIRASDPELDRALARLGDELDAQPKLLMHRDFHAWNLHLDPSGALRVIDFQDALIGPALYDLASLCTDRDSFRFVSRGTERRLVARFSSELLRRGGPDLGPAERLERMYLTAVVYRTVRVIGRFGLLALEKGKPGYLRFVPAMGRQTRRALDALGERELAGLLAARSPVFA